MKNQTPDPAGRTAGKHRGLGLNNPQGKPPVTLRPLGSARDRLHSGQAWGLNMDSRLRGNDNVTSVGGKLSFGRFKDSNGVFAGLLGRIECLVGTACNVLGISISVVLAEAHADR